jgi:hypothetical protein
MVIDILKGIVLMVVSYIWSSTKRNRNYIINFIKIILNKVFFKLHRI